MDSPRTGWVDEKGRLWGKIHWIDLLAIIFVLNLFWVVIYVYHLTRLKSLAVHQVVPTHLIAGMDQVLTIIGSGFSSTDSVHLSQRPVSASYLNEARLEVPLPPDITPGRVTVYVRNRLGRLATLPSAFEVIWRPVVEEARPRQFSWAEKTDLEVLGRYFDERCQISVGDKWVKASTYLSPERVKVEIPAGALAPGRYGVQVTNLYGGQTSFLENGIEIITPAPTELAVFHHAPTELAVFRLGRFGFHEAFWGQFSPVRSGSIIRSTDGEVVARVLDRVLHPIPAMLLVFDREKKLQRVRRLRGRQLDATLVLVGEMADREGGRQFFFQGEIGRASCRERVCQYV